MIERPLVDFADSRTTVRIIPLMYLLSAETALSIYCICLPAIYSLVRRVMRDGLASMFSTTTTSKARLNRSLQASTNERRHHASETEVELLRTSVSDSGVPALYSAPEYPLKATTTKASFNGYRDLEAEGGFKKFGIHVQKQVHVRSEQPS